MAKKVANGMNKRQSRRRNTETDSNFEIGSGVRNFSSSEYSQRLREFIDNPAVRYVAGGIATAVLTRLATNMSEKYPELAKFLRENIDSFEGRLGQYRSGFGGGQERESQV